MALVPSERNVEIVALVAVLLLVGVRTSEIVNTNAVASGIIAAPVVRTNVLVPSVQPVVAAVSPAGPVVNETMGVAGMYHPR